jgi:hypothetical protein
MPVEAVRDAWASMRDQIRAEGLHLGVRFELPPELGQRWQ